MKVIITPVFINLRKLEFSHLSHCPSLTTIKQKFLCYLKIISELLGTSCSEQIFISSILFLVQENIFFAPLFWTLSLNIYV